MSDEMIQALAKKGGVIQINFGSAFITSESNHVLIELLTERKKFLAENSLASDSPQAQAWVTAFREEHKTRRVRKTRWYPASGTVWQSFDDVLVLASNSSRSEWAARLIQIF